MTPMPAYSKFERSLLENAFCDQTNPAALIKIGSTFPPVSLDLIHLGSTSC